MKKKVMIIGAGFAGLSAAAFMARAGWEVKVVEKNSGPGGRARQLKAEGFTFDMGPSWYWMPDVFERYFLQFGKQVSDYYSLRRLDPSYRVYWPEGPVDIPANYSALELLFEKIEPGSARQLKKYLAEAGVKYRIGMQELVYQPGLSAREFLHWDLIREMMRLKIFRSVSQHVARHFKDARLRQLMEFPVLFLGALPGNTPALYSLMNYADIIGGTWYPDGGMYSVVRAMEQLAKEQGAEFLYNEEAKEIIIEKGLAKTLLTDRGSYEADAIISGADYHFTETRLLPDAYRSYTDAYWNSRMLAPSCLLYFTGLNKKLEGLQHHSLFFDVPFEPHADQMYTRPGWPDEPLFYVNAGSRTDASIAPEGCENLVFLIPVASGLKQDTEGLRQHYFEKIVQRMEKFTGYSISDSIIYQRSYSVSDFTRDYHSFRGNAYGLANVLRQTALFRPSCRSKKVNNLFYAGQLTVPGPGVPPSLISGELASGQLLQSFNRISR